MTENSKKILVQKNRPCPKDDSNICLCKRQASSCVYTERIAVRNHSSSHCSSKYWQAWTFCKSCQLLVCLRECCSLAHHQQWPTNSNNEYHRQYLDSIIDNNKYWYFPAIIVQPHLDYLFDSRIRQEICWSIKSFVGFFKKLSSRKVSLHACDPRTGTHTSLVLVARVYWLCSFFWSFMHHLIRRAANYWVHKLI